MAFEEDYSNRTIFQGNALDHISHADEIDLTNYCWTPIKAKF